MKWLLDKMMKRCKSLHNLTDKHIISDALTLSDRIKQVANFNKFLNLNR